MPAPKLFYTILLVSILAGCVPSLHKLYTSNTLTYDPRLVGCWEASEDEQWCFTRHEEEDAYDLIITEEKGKRSYMLAHLVDLDGRRFLDIEPGSDAELCTGDWYKYHLQPVHTFMMVDQVDPNLALAVMKPDVVQEMIEKNPKLIKHEIVDDRVILTAETPQLQAFLENPDILDKIYDKPAYLTRYKAK